MNAVHRVRAGTFGLILLFVASACGSAATTSAPPTGSGYHSPAIAVSTTAADVIGSAEVDPLVDAVIEGKGPDGTDYRLDIPAFTLTQQTTISMRPLKPVAIPGGQLVAGVELGPEGTTFMLPVSLKITPASGGTANLVPFQYSGSPDAATASLAAMKAIDPGSIELWLEHFSGAFVAKATDAQSASNWAAVPPAPLGGTAAERSAWAQAVITAAQHDLDTGLRPDMKADNEAIIDRAWEILAKAEAELAVEKGIQDKVEAGQLEDALAVIAGLTKMGGKAIEQASNKAPCNTLAAIVDALKPVLDAKAKYFDKVIKNLKANKAFQKVLTDGNPSDYDYMVRVMSTFTGSIKQDVGIGVWSETDDLMQAQVLDWAHTYGLNLVSKNAPSTSADWQKMLGAMRHAQLVGDEAVHQASPCIPLPGMTCPPHADVVPGADGAQLAEANVCAPSPSPGGLTYEGTITGTFTVATKDKVFGSVIATTTAKVTLKTPYGPQSRIVQDSGTISVSARAIPGNCDASGSVEGEIRQDGPEPHFLFTPGGDQLGELVVDDGAIGVPGGPDGHGTALFVSIRTDFVIDGMCGLLRKGPPEASPIHVYVNTCPGAAPSETSLILKPAGPGVFKGSCHSETGADKSTTETADWTGEFHLVSP